MEVAVGTALLIRYLYSLCFCLALPFVFLRLLWRSLKEPVYRASLLQRLGMGEKLICDNLIWIHAVSAGETIAAAPLARRLLDHGYDILMTNMTPTGRERASALLGKDVENRYAPYDTPGAVKRFLQRTKPRVLVIIDTELWPNMLHYSAEYGIKVIVVNGRLSDKSTRGYEKINALSRPMMEAISHVAAQSQPQGDRFVKLGLSRKKLTVTGSTKFDVEHSSGQSEAADRLAEDFQRRFVIVAASTHGGEEEQMLIALGAFEDTLPEALLVLVPRHPHRAQEVFKLCERFGYCPQLHSSGEELKNETSVYLLDTMGELMAFFAMANAAFVGGSLVSVGGHNPMEPSSFGLPVFMGPFIRNVSDIAQQFIDEGAMKIVHSGKELAAEIQIIRSSSSEVQLRVEASKRVMDRNKGALKNVENIIVTAMNGSV